MSHKVIRQFIEDTAKGLQDTLKFGYGKVSDFNSKADKRFPYVWLDPLQVTAKYTNNDTATLSTQWAVSMVFYKIDELGSSEVEYAKILDETYILLTRFVDLLNRNPSEDTTAELTTDKLLLSNIKAEPIIKVLSDCLTGWMLTFTITAPDLSDCL